MLGWQVTLSGPTFLPLGVAPHINTVRRCR